MLFEFFTVEEIHLNNCALIDSWAKKNKKKLENKQSYENAELEAWRECLSKIKIITNIFNRCIKIRVKSMGL